MKKGILIIFTLLLAVSLVGWQTYANENAATTGEPEIGRVENGTTSKEPIVNDSTENRKSDSTIDPNTPVSNTPNNQGITVNTIPFKTEVDIADSIKTSIMNNKVSRGYEFFINQDGSITFVVYAGEKTSGGYGIKVVSVEDNEGKTNIIVEESSPQPGEMVTTVITYPYTAITFTGTTDQFNVVDIDGTEFKMIN